MDEQASVSLEELRAQCQALEPAVLRAQLATAEELATHKPGASNNPQEGARGWLRYLIVLQRRHSALERNPKAKGSSKQEAQLIKVLAGEPEYLTLSDPGQDGKRAPLAVHPKSLRTLIALHKLDRRIALLAEHVRVLQQEQPQTSQTLDLYGRVLDAIAYYQGLILWTLDTPGPKLPWGKAPVTSDLPLPDKYQDLNPIDVYRIAEVHQQVHNTRLQALEGINGTGGNGDNSRPTFSIFISVTAMELGVSAEELAEEWSLPSVFGQAHIAATARHEAAQRAADAAKDRAR